MLVELNENIKFSCKPVQQSYGQYDIMRSEFQRFIQNDYTIVVLAETEAKKERIQSMINEMHIPTLIDTPSTQSDGGSAIITEGSLTECFELSYIYLVVDIG